MFDTLRVTWPGIAAGQGVREHVLSRWPEAGYSQRSYAQGQPWEALAWQDKKLGVMSIKSSRLGGNVLVAERSIPKYLYGENARLLSYDEALEGAAAWMADCVAAFEGHWELSTGKQRGKVKRIDLCYQRALTSTAEVFPYIAAALRQRKVSLYELLNPCSRAGEDDEFLIPQMSVHHTGVSVNHNRWEHTRWYDKGMESGDERYIGVLRHEEEFKGGKAGAIAIVLEDGSLHTLGREALRDMMNERYVGWGDGEAYDLGKLLLEHGTTGTAAALLVLHPELEPLAKQHLAKSTFYRVRALAEDQRRLRVPLDLRLPDDAWQESMVL